MAVQLTLFGPPPLGKGRFFRELANPARDAVYYAVIEAFWTLQQDFLFHGSTAEVNCNLFKGRGSESSADLIPYNQERRLAAVGLQ